MKKLFNKNGLIVVTILAVVGFGTYASADWGMGMHGPAMGMYGGGMGHGGRGWGAGNFYRNSGPYGNAATRGNLSEDEIKKLDQQRSAFLKDTEPLRREIYEKEMALRSELAKQNPDVQKAVDIQKEISQRKGRFAQKQVTHMIEMRKAHTGVNYTEACGIGYGMGGPGMMGGRGMMGYGMGGRGMMGGPGMMGYGMGGRGMMAGPGMMGYGMGGPGMMAGRGMMGYGMGGPGMMAGPGMMGYGMGGPGMMGYGMTGPGGYCRW